MPLIYFRHNLLTGLKNAPPAGGFFWTQPKTAKDAGAICRYVAAMTKHAGIIIVRKNPLIQYKL